MRMTLSINTFFSFLFFYAIAMPFFHNQIGSAGILVVNGALILFIAFFILMYKGLTFSFENRVHKKIALLYLTPLLFFIFLIPISMGVGLFFGGISIVERDFFELYRPVFYVLVFLFSYMYFSRKDSIEYFEKLIIAIFIIVVLLGLNHFFRAFDSISELYTKSHNIRTRRVSVPFVNPYDYAFFMTFFIYYFFVKFLYDRLVYLPFFLLSVVMFVLPQSRSVAAGFIVGFFLIMPLFLTYSGFKLKTFRINSRLLFFYLFFIFFVMSFIVSIPYLIENFSYLTGQFIRLLESGEVGGSAGTRLEQFLFALDKAIVNPFIMLFGNGPAKDEMEFVESIYNYFFYRYGLVGVILYFHLLLLTLFFCFKVIKSLAYQSKCYALFMAMFLWFMTIPLLSIGNNFTEQARTSFFYYMLLGLVAASYYQIVIKKDN
ncbi:hypothetical protein [Vibrio cincinnatiensis]|uniref:hypothetical protein n=1 Tax=Vibrio cincinnatiensis TaxID=675 RepID=UPI001EE00B89|nr:hypothetical protein [Vibrio cincinnatiensis]MCG3727437.1 hypothetical protein [Vibrio cincinnatiensis]